jgi:hypothetical protein
MSISIAAKVRARSAGDRCRPQPTTRLHRRNCADRDGAAGRPGLCIHRSPFGREHGAEQPNVTGLGWRAAAHNARLGRDELTVLLVAQANGFRRNAKAPGASVIRGKWRRDCDCIFNRSDKWHLSRRFRNYCRRRMQSFLTIGRRPLDRCKLFRGIRLRPRRRRR